MDRTIILEQHIIEGWGLWWIQWQKDQANSVRRMAETLVRSKSKGLGLNPKVTTRTNLPR